MSSSPEDALAMCLLQLSQDHESSIARLCVLLAGKPDLSKPILTGLTPLMVAAGIGDAKACRLLIEAGADVNVATPTGLTPLLHSLGSTSSVEGGAWQVLIKYGADVNAGNRKIGGALGRAVNGNNLKTVRALLKAGALVDGIADSYCTPLTQAASMGHDDICRVLIKSGADLNARTNSILRTPLCSAAYDKRKSTCTLLIKAGADLDLPDHTGTTPLMYVSGGRYCDFAMIRELVEAGADVARIDVHGRTALDFCKGSKHFMEHDFLSAHLLCKVLKTHTPALPASGRNRVRL